MISKENRIVSNWIFLGVFMLIIQVLLGGITRLTGSGLSITEWKPIMGAFFPSGNEAWEQTFTQYKQIAQYKYINNHFTLQDFKFIFFWEWFHRLWARLIAVAFAIPFIYFLFKGYIKKQMINPLIILFLLGALQGAIGWIMVKSGLNDENLYVSHIKLSVHFVSAMLLIVYALIVGLSLRIQSNQKTVSPSLKKATFFIISVLVIQLFYGAFMAGLKAANTAPTWPLINGEIVPEAVLRDGFTNVLFFNKISIQFIHRMLAYTLFILAIWWWFKAKKTANTSLFYSYKNIPLYIIVLQLILGICAVLLSPKIVAGSFGIFEWIALLHQLVGMVLLLSLCGVGYLLKWKE